MSVEAVVQGSSCPCADKPGILAGKMQCAAWAFAPRCIGHRSALRLPLHRTA